MKIPVDWTQAPGNEVDLSIINFLNFEMHKPKVLVVKLQKKKNRACSLIDRHESFLVVFEGVWLWQRVPELQQEMNHLLAFGHDLRPACHVA